MTDRCDDVATCVASLTSPGVCCWLGCSRPATVALLFDDGDRLTECARCSWHADDERAISSKPMPPIRSEWSQP